MPFLLPDGYSEELFEHLYDPEQNHEEYQRINALTGENLLSHVAFKLTSQHHELKLVRAPECQYELLIALLDHESETILYSNTIDKVELDIPNDGRPVRQIMIWRDIETNAGDDSHGLVETVFFDFLIEQYNIVVSDSEQTREGRRMWRKLISMAISKGLEAGRIDQTKHSYDLIRNRSELNEAAKWLWGEDDIHRDRLAVIMKL
ncbi:hypothetical protein [Endozoicomonas sp. NE40]|uniref:Rpn family recombination-promoting nuclease/putative transposase n=2 Tax=Endozoicomonas lisbonensis TaxID=3120522 RepID=A0ABV2SRP4_9GAMM